MIQAPPEASGKRIVTAAILGLLGLWLIACGAYLAYLGGSLYYVLTGLAVSAAGWAFFKGDRRGGHIYGAVLVGTLLWTLATAGFNPWQWQSRLLPPLVLGILVYWPELRARAKIALPVLALGVIGFAVWLVSVNQLDTPSAFAASGSPDTGPASGEWRHYGNVQAGTRFSPLDQINPSNIDKLQHAWT